MHCQGSGMLWLHLGEAVNYNGNGSGGCERWGNEDIHDLRY